MHSLFSDMNDADALAFGLAAGCLKHSILGDVFPLDAADVATFLPRAAFRCTSLSDIELTHEAGGLKACAYIADISQSVDASCYQFRF